MLYLLLVIRLKGALPRVTVCQEADTDTVVVGRDARQGTTDFWCGQLMEEVQSTDGALS